MCALRFYKKNIFSIKYNKTCCIATMQSLKGFIFFLFSKYIKGLVPAVTTNITAVRVSHLQRHSRSKDAHFVW